VILVDANLLVYARVSGMPEHEAAREWLDDRLNGAPRVGLPWPSLLAYMRLVTNPRVFERPETVDAAWKQVEQWLDIAAVWIPTPGDRHRQILGGMLASIGGRANLVPDAHLAALAVEHGLTLCSTDGDFGRFPGLRWVNPIAS
jgi:toxin-antitoxin system PIN domain toxin